MSHYRSGHWRRGRNGKRHWVSGHSVNRYGGTGSRFVRPSWTYRTNVSAWAAPNATCPVCGARVFYYRDPRTGGGAYFDRMGVPWPKHPCMDAAQQVTPPHIPPAATAPRMTWSSSSPAYPPPAWAPAPLHGTIQRLGQRRLSEIGPSTTAALQTLRPWVLWAIVTATFELVALFLLMVAVVGPDTPRAEIVAFIWLWVLPIASLAVAAVATVATRWRALMGLRLLDVAIAFAAAQGFAVAGLVGHGLTCGLGLNVLGVVWIGVLLHIVRSPQTRS